MEFHADHTTLRLLDEKGCRPILLQNGKYTAHLERYHVEELERYPYSMSLYKVHGHELVLHHSPDPNYSAILVVMSHQEARTAHQRRLEYVSG